MELDIFKRSFEYFPRQVKVMECQPLLKKKEATNDFFGKQTNNIGKSYGLPKWE